MKSLRIVAISILLITVAVLLCGCVAKVPVPEVKEGRFDFSVTYEIDGEVKTYSGVYVCEYDGALTTFLGSSIKWKGYVENDETDVAIQTKEDGVVYINFGFFPEYFMGDTCYDQTPAPSLFMIYNDSEPDSLNITGEEDVIAGYGVKLISYEYAAPIENSFEEKLTFSSFEPSIN
jgi:hypothetical protein